MGVGASIPAELGKAEARECAGKQWRSEFEQKFDEIQVDGKITRQQFMKNAPLQTLETRHSIFHQMTVHAPLNKKETDERMMRRPTAAAKPHNKDQNAALAALAAKKRAEEAKIDEDEEEEEDEPKNGGASNGKGSRRQSEHELAIEVCKTMENYNENRDLSMAKFVSKLARDRRARYLFPSPRARPRPKIVGQALPGHEEPPGWRRQHQLVGHEVRQAHGEGLARHVRRSQNLSLKPPISLRLASFELIL